jgi:hypothetical protein
VRPGSGLIRYSGVLTCEFLGALFAKYPTFRDWSIVFTYANHSGNKQNDKTAALPEGLQLRTAPGSSAWDHTRPRGYRRGGLRTVPCATAIDGRGGLAQRAWCVRDRCRRMDRAELMCGWMGCAVVRVVGRYVSTFNLTVTATMCNAEALKENYASVLAVTGATERPLVSEALRHGTAWLGDHRRVLQNASVRRPAAALCIAAQQTARRCLSMRLAHCSETRLQPGPSSRATQALKSRM